MGGGRCGRKPCGPREMCAVEGCMSSPYRPYRPYHPSRRNSHPATVWDETKVSPDDQPGREEGAMGLPPPMRSFEIFARAAVGARCHESRARTEGSNSTSPDRDRFPETFRVSRRSEEGCCPSCCASRGREKVSQVGGRRSERGVGCKGEGRAIPQTCL